MKNIRKSFNKTMVSAIAGFGLLGGGTLPLTASADTTTWTNNAILIDNSSLDDKISRYDNDATYQQAVKSFADSLTKKDYAAGGYYSHYLIMWDTHLNPKITHNVVKGFDIPLYNSSNTYLNENIGHIIDCRNELLGDKEPASRLLKFREIRGCAIDHMETAHQDQKAKYQYRLQNVRYDNLATLKEKIDQYETGRTGGKDHYFRPYYDAVKDAAGKDDNESSTGSLYHSNYIRVWHAHLDTSFTHKDIAAAQDGQLKNYTTKSIYTWDNVGHIIDCRNKIIGNTALEQITDPKETFNQVHACSAKRIGTTYKAEQDKLFKNGIEHIQSDISPLDTKISYIKKGKEKDSFYHPYYASASKQGNYEFKNDISKNKSLVNDVRMWHFHLDTSMAITDLTGLKDENEFKSHDETEPYVNANLQHVEKCRTETLGNTQISQIKNPKESYEQINECAVNHINDDYIVYQDYLNEVELDKYVDQSITNREQYNLLKQAHTTPIAAEELSKHGMIENDLNTLSLSHNFTYVLSCRDDLKNNLTYETVHECAGKKLNDATNEKHDELINKLTYAFGGLGGAALLGLGLGVASNRRKRRPAPPKPN